MKIISTTGLSVKVHTQSRSVISTPNMYTVSVYQYTPRGKKSKFKQTESDLADDWG